MTKLTVPFYKMEISDGCALAAFHMVYKFHRPSKLTVFKQDKKAFARMAQADTQAEGRHMISTDNLIKYAQSRNFNSGSGRVDPNPEAAREQIEHFLKTLEIPLIACQQYTPEQPNRGHFRVVYGIEGDTIHFHDPDVAVGGPEQVATLQQFLKQWAYTSLDNVTGGVAVWVAPDPVEHTLDPIESRKWIELAFPNAPKY